jgi:hypothetical protein
VCALLRRSGGLRLGRSSWQRRVLDVLKLSCEQEDNEKEQQDDEHRVFVPAGRE